MQRLQMTFCEMDIGGHFKVAMSVIKTRVVLVLRGLLEVAHSPSAADWLNASCAPLSWHPRQPAPLGIESWCHLLGSQLLHWNVFYHNLAPMQTYSSNYWKQASFWTVARTLQGHCCLGPCYMTTTKNQKFFHVGSKSHCAIEVHNNWQMPKPIIAPTATTKMITAFPSVKCVPCSVSHLK